MAKEKSSKMSILTEGNSANKTTASGRRGVFKSAMFTSDVVNSEESSATNDYKYTSIPIEHLIYHSPANPGNQAFYNSVAERIVSPVFVTYDFIEKQKAGRSYKEKTGKYKVIDGNARVSIYDSLYHQAEEDGDLDRMKKYNHVPAIVLPMETSEEEVGKIRDLANAHKLEGAKDVIRDITETQKESITYCYHYETAEIPLEKLVERENKYRILPSEVNELEKSIFSAGLMQPIIVLPIIDARTLDIKYEIQAGHKRTRAVRQLVEHAKAGWYPTAKDIILESFQKIPALIIPMGATPEQVEQIYNDTNLLSRHMTSEDVFQHISYFSEMPSRPTTKEDFVHFKQNGYQIKDLCKILQQRFKTLGFQDWKATKASYFLNVYYYGSDLAQKALENLKEYNLTQKQINWIVTQNKDFVDRKKQDEIIEKTKEDKQYIINLMNESKRNWIPSQTTYGQVSSALISQRKALEKLQQTELTTSEKVQVEDIQQTMAVIDDIEVLLKDIRKKIGEISK